MLHLDFETRGMLDLKSCGAYLYSLDPHTEVICMAYSFTPEEEIKLWRAGDPFPFHLNDYVSKGHPVIAHNVSFEMNIWNNVLAPKYNLIPILVHQVTCTMALCYQQSFPGTLEEASIALRLKVKKDMIGKAVMMRLSRPRSVVNDIPIYWKEEDDILDEKERFKLLYDYCRTDVLVEKEIHKALRPLSKKEREVFELDYQINKRGIKVDLHAVVTAMKLTDTEKDYLNDKMRIVTRGEVNSCYAVAALSCWIRNRGVDIASLDKASIVKLLSEDHPQEVKDALLLRQQAAKTSTAKLKAMIEGSDEYGRMRELFQYHGANTGRWSGRRVQLQNLPRPKLSQKDINDIFKMFKNFHGNLEQLRETIDLMYAPVMDVISDCLRGFIVPEDGHEFIAVDFSAIEARVLAWVAGQDDVLDIFRGNGKIYEHAASQIYKVPIDKVTKLQRQIGKVAILALGYQGGVRAFQSMAKNYAVEISELEADTIKTAWRESNHHIVRFWYQLEDAAMRAVTHKGKLYSAGKIKISFKVVGDHLLCQLPSGRIINYPYPVIVPKLTPWGVAKDMVSYQTRNGITRQWEASYLYGGLICENVVQAIARDLLSDAMLNLESKNYPVVLHAHDEVVCELPKNFGSLEEMKQIMCSSSPWAEGLPLSSEGWTGERYRKD